MVFIFESTFLTNSVFLVGTGYIKISLSEVLTIILNNSALDYLNVSVKKICNVKIYLYIWETKLVNQYKLNN